MKIIYTILALGLLLCSCSHNNKVPIETVNDEESLPVLDISGNLTLSIPDTFTWNSIAKHVKFIPLSSKVLLGASTVIRHLGEDINLIVDYQRQVICSFDSEGKLKSSFRHVGNGPGEYVYISYVKFNDKDSSITVFDNNGKLLKYTLAGKCIDEKNMKDRQWTNIRYIDTSNKIYTKNASEGKSLVSVLNQDYIIEKQFFEFDTITTERRKACISLNMARSNTVDKYLINRSFDDTLYMVENSVLKPICILNKGIHGLSEEESENFMKLPFNNDYFLSTSVNVFSSYVLYTYTHKENFNAEVWDLDSQRKIASVKRPRGEGGTAGFKYLLSSSKAISIYPNYISDTKLGFLIPAEWCVGEIEGVKDDDNPVLMVIDL